MPQSHIAGWTPESPTPAQLAEFFRQIEQGRITKSLLQSWIRGDSLPVTTDYGRKVKAALDAGKYDSSYSYINPEFIDADLPALGNGREKTIVGLRKRKETTTSQQWVNSLDLSQQSDEKFAHPLSVLAIGEEHPDEQREDPIITIWTSPRTGRLWYLVLDGIAGSRRVSLYRTNPGSRFDAYYRAAVVAKSK